MSAARESLADLLNRDCDCTCTDLQVLHRRLDADLGEVESSQSIVDTHPHLFSETPVFLDPAEALAMQRIVEAVETVVSLPRFSGAVIGHAPPLAHAPQAHDWGVRGVRFSPLVDRPEADRDQHQRGRRLPEYRRA